MATGGLADFSYIDGAYGGGYDGATYGGAEGAGMFGTILWGLLILIVLIIIWRSSDFRKDRVCVSTNMRDWWPAGVYGMPALPGNDYLPSVSQYLPAESLAVPDINRSRTDSILMRAARGENVL